MLSRIAIALLSASLLPVGVAQAQHANSGSGHASGGHPAFTGGPHFSGGAATGMHLNGPSRPAGTGVPRAATRHFMTAATSNHPLGFNNCFNNPNCRFSHRRDHDRFFPVFSYVYPLGYPYYGDIYGDNYVDTNAQQQPAYPAYNDNNNAQTNEQLDRLTYEVEQLRADQQSAQQKQQQENTPKDLGMITPTVLVFPDGHRMEVNNYAIVGKTVWVLSDHAATQKILLSQLDIPATVKANQENGVDFTVP